MVLFKVLLDPVDEVVLESTLYRLMEEIGGEQLMDIRTREVGRKWLWVVE